MESDSPKLIWQNSPSYEDGLGITLDGPFLSLEQGLGDLPRLPLVLLTAASGENYVVSNQNPRQPLRINDVMVRQAQLNHGDVLQMGNVEMVYESPWPRSPPKQPLTPLTLIGSLICSAILFALLLPFLTAQIAGTAAGNVASVSATTGAGSSPQSGTAPGTSENGASKGEGSGNGQNTGTKGSQGGNSLNPAGTTTEGKEGSKSAGPKGDGESSAPKQAAAPVKKAPSGAPAQGSKPQENPSPAPAPPPKMVFSLDEEIIPPKSGVALSWNGGNIFSGYEKAESFVFVVDRSGSMSGGKLDEAKAQMHEIIEGRLKNGQGKRFAVVYFDDKKEEMSGAPGLLSLTAENVKKMRQWSDAVGPRGGTDPTDSMIAALDMKPQLIFLLSDGEFNNKIVDKIRAANVSKSIICSLAIWFDSTNLRDIADQNKGTMSKGDYRYIPR
ncbi:MAG TPA: VWA domain-containing protein [Prosthecobacter sp.]|jgi:hypothetical protein|nr:VWA domain-containing protein [Prosthecobacter sp.]